MEVIERAMHLYENANILNVETIRLELKLIIEELKNTSPKKPILMQLAEPEYMCPKCGNKFYLEIKDDRIVLDSRPEKCSHCGIKFVWNSK